jgi:hypothetical protein
MDCLLPRQPKLRGILLDLVLSVFVWRSIDTLVWNFIHNFFLALSQREVILLADHIRDLLFVFYFFIYVFKFIIKIVGVILLIFIAFHFVVLLNLFICNIILL